MKKYLKRIMYPNATFFMVPAETKDHNGREIFAKVRQHPAHGDVKIFSGNYYDGIFEYRWALSDDRGATDKEENILKTMGIQKPEVKKYKALKTLCYKHADFYMVSENTLDIDNNEIIAEVRKHPVCGNVKVFSGYHYSDQFEFRWSLNSDMEETDTKENILKRMELL